jgi:hypothetical protein
MILGVRLVPLTANRNRVVPGPQFESDVTDKIDQLTRDEIRFIVEGGNQIVADKTKGIRDAEPTPQPRDSRRMPLSDAARSSGPPFVEHLGCGVN